jgi:hypothetical protein
VPPTTSSQQNNELLIVFESASSTASSVIPTQKIIPVAISSQLTTSARNTPIFEKNIRGKKINFNKTVYQVNKSTELLPRKILPKPTTKIETIEDDKKEEASSHESSSVNGSKISNNSKNNVVKSLDYQVPVTSKQNGIDINVKDKDKEKDKAEESLKDKRSTLAKHDEKSKKQKVN